MGKSEARRSYEAIADGSACPQCATRFSDQDLAIGRCHGCGAMVVAASPEECRKDADRWLRSYNRAHKKVEKYLKNHPERREDAEKVAR